MFNVFDRTNVRYRTYEVTGATLAASDVTFVGRAVNVFTRFAF